MSFHSISQCSIKVSVIGRSVQPYVIDEMAPVLFDENQFEQGIDFKEKQFYRNQVAIELLPVELKI